MMFITTTLLHHLAQTKLNRESSRSHAVFSIIVEHSTLSTDSEISSDCSHFFLSEMAIFLFCIRTNFVMSNDFNILNTCTSVVMTTDDTLEYT